MSGEHSIGPIFEGSPHPTLVVESETTEIIAANAAASDLFGLPREQLRTRNLTALRDNGTERSPATANDTATTWEISHPDGVRTVDVQFRQATISGAERTVAYFHQPAVDTDTGPTQSDHLKTVIGKLPVILFALDGDGTFTMSRGSALAELGLDPGEAVGSSVHEMHADQPEILDKIDRALSGETVRYTAEIGTQVFETWLQPEVDDEGTVQAVLGLSRDITEQRERDRRLEENSAILQQLTETTEDVFWLFDSDFTELQFVNDAYEEVWGEPIDALQEDAMSFMNGVHPDDHETVIDGIQDLKNGESSKEEYRVNADDSFSRWVSVHGEPIFDEDGSVTRVAGYARDITERKQRERRLEALSEATRTLPLAKTPDDVARRIVEIGVDVLQRPLTAIWSYDEELDRLTLWQASDRDSALAEATDPRNIKGSETFEMDVFRGTEPVAVEDYSSLAQAANPDLPLTSVLFVPIGEYALLAMGTESPSTFSNAEQNLVSILASNAETAFQRAEREQELETYKDKLEESNKNLQEFAYIASHDLQEPLRSVTSYLDLLETEYSEQLDEDGEFYIERATSNATQMSTMVNALLQYSRVKTDAGTFEAIDTERLVEDTIETIELLIREHRAEITVDPLPTVSADRDQLGQVFQNLVTNAVEHGGEPPKIEITAEQTAVGVTFAVSDNGAGIPEAHHDRIFEIFQQATTDTDGAGIGLAICERIVSRHDGEIWVESDETGSTFKFTLPKEDSRTDGPDNREDNS